MAAKFSRNERNWILYDVANSAFILLATAIIPIYYDSLVSAAGIDGSMTSWAYAQTAVTLIIALLMPVLGSLADFKGNKIKFFMGFLFTGAIALTVLSIPTNWKIFIGIYMFARVCLSTSIMFYDAMLVDVASNDRMNKVSANGYAWGYIGSVIPFIICLLLIMFPQTFGLTTGLATRFSFIICAIWWVGFSIPLIRSYEQVHFKMRIEGEVHNAFVALKGTVGKIWRDKTIFWFMLAYFFYIDGVNTVIAMSTSYGTNLGIDGTQMLLALLVTQVVAFPSAIFYGRLGDKFGTLRMIFVGVCAYVVIVLFGALFLHSAREFWMLAIAIGLFQGGIQALSRSYFGKIVPKKNANEFYGFFDIFGKYASALGTFLVGWVAAISGYDNYGILAVGILLIIAAVIIIFMPRRETSTQ